jgi:hypothetical protein
MFSLSSGGRGHNSEEYERFKRDQFDAAFTNTIRFEMPPLGIQVVVSFL